MKKKSKSQTTASPGKPVAPEYFEVVVSPEAERRPPTVSNVVGVSGTTDMINIDFFYVHPNRISRIEEYGGDASEGIRRGDTFYINTEPVSQIAIPLTTATELMLQVFKTIMFGMPRMQRELGNFDSRMKQIIELAAQISQASATAKVADVDTGESENG